MFYTTRGIVFKQVKYSESSIVAKIFTEEFGLQSYMVKGVRSRSSRNKPALFQPLTLLELVVSHKENKTMNHLKEIRVAYAYQSIPLEMEKRSVLFFLNELLYRSIREETPNKPLFDWLFNSLTWFDMNTTGTLNFHLVFMLQLSRFLGFYPRWNPGQQYGFFDLQEGVFTVSAPGHPQFLSGESVDKLEQLQQCNFEDSGKLPLNNSNRRQLLEVLHTYYRLHLPGFGEMKSMEVLRTVLA